MKRITRWFNSLGLRFTAMRCGIPLSRLHILSPRESFGTYLPLDHATYQGVGCAIHGSTRADVIVEATPTCKPRELRQAVAAAAQRNANVPASTA